MLSRMKIYSTESKAPKVDTSIYTGSSGSCYVYYKLFKLDGAEHYKTRFLESLQGNLELVKSGKC